MPKVQGFNSGAITSGGPSAVLSYPINALQNIQPDSLRQAVLDEYGLSIQRIWQVMCPLVGIGFLLTFLMKVYTLDRKSNRLPGKGDETLVADKQNASPTEKDVEKGGMQAEAASEEADTGLKPGVGLTGENAAETAEQSVVR